MEAIKIAKIPIKSNKTAVQELLNSVHKIIDDSDFNIDKHFRLIRSEKDDVKHSTPYTLLDLEYDAEDVINTIRQLTVREYSETLFDRDDEHPPLLFVFGKEINQKTIYIKLKIKENNQKYILCVSFHYAEHEMKFPYA